MYEWLTLLEVLVPPALEPPPKTEGLFTTLVEDPSPPRPECSPESLSSSFLRPLRLFLMVAFMASKGETSFVAVVADVLKE